MTKKFLDNVFFPYIHKNNIKRVIHLGDLFDRRKYVNFLTANRVRTDFLTPLQTLGCNVDILVGNHDTYYKNTNDINSLKELVDGKYENVNIYTNPLEISIDGLKVLYVPWICDDNRKHTFDLIKDTKAQICMGHLELAGFQMFKGSIPSHGDNPENFSKFDMVFSGHFHHRSSSGNVFYLGSHSEFTWSDYSDPRGFHIFDTNTRELQFIENPYRIFKKIWYDDVQLASGTVKEEVENCASSIVKVIVKNKENPYAFDQFITELEKQNPIELQIVEDHYNLNLEMNVDVIDEAESTVDIFMKYIDNVQTLNVDSKDLKTLVMELYSEASNIQ